MRRSKKRTKWNREKKEREGGRGGTKWVRDDEGSCQGKGNSITLLSDSGGPKVEELMSKADRSKKRPSSNLDLSILVERCASAK